MKDTIKPICASIGGMSVQFADIDWVIKITIGLLTIFYLGIKCWKAWNHRNE